MTDNEQRSSEQTVESGAATGPVKGHPLAGLFDRDRRPVAVVVAGAAALMVGTGAAAWLSPTWMPDKIVNAAKAGDRDRLEQLIDFRSARSSFEEDLQDAFGVAVRNQMSSDDPLTLLFGGLATEITDGAAKSVAEQLISPRTFERAARGDEIQFEIMGSPTRIQFDADTDGATGLNFDTSGRYLSNSRFEFKLRSKTSDHRGYIQMQRTGLFSWRVDRIRLDPEWAKELASLDSQDDEIVGTPESADPMETADYEGPRVDPGTLYADYRRDLLGEGFEPVIQPRSGDESFCGTEYLDPGEPDLCIAYPEVEDCAGTGSRPCTFVFRRRDDGQTLIVTTTGELFDRLTVSNTHWRG